MKRRTAREKALQALFQMQVGKTSPEEALENVLEDLPETELKDPFLHALVHQTSEHLEEIDATIKKHLINWDIERIANVDRAILRLGICELLFMNEAPEKVVLNEMIELAKQFGDDDSRRFTNGVLSKVLQEKLNKQGESK